MNTVCVYCGCSDKLGGAYLRVAHEMGEAVARRGLKLAYGAGRTGMMGALAEGALEAGGEVIGVIPQMFATPALMHNGLTHLEIVQDMHTRKQRLVDLADAFVALPGGYGTFEELFEVLTWAQIGLHSKPVGILNKQHYFDPLLALIDKAHEQGFIYAEHRALFVCAEQPERLLDMLEDYRYPLGMERWVTRQE